MEKLIEECVAPTKRVDIAVIIEQMAHFHPEEPHWYLPFIGVDPARQGTGLGSMLLRMSLSKFETAKLPIYLESTNPKNQLFYERHGFELIGEISVSDCPPIIPMVRRPRQ